jgi:hypothetical protein
MFENGFNNIDRVMRNDDGLPSELDYAEQTSWLLFLKYLDDLESEREDAAVLLRPLADGSLRVVLRGEPEDTGPALPDAGMLPA